MLQFLPLLGTVLDKILPDTNQREAAKEQLSRIALSQEGKEIEGRFAVLAEEARSEHWIVAAWRPITMLTFVAIIANNYILAPYIQLFFEVNVTLVLPPDLWDLLKIGLGGYVVSRGAEKVSKNLKGK